jgi:hypothetical protein
LWCLRKDTDILELDRGRYGGLWSLIQRLVFWTQLLAWCSLERTAFGTGQVLGRHICFLNSAIVLDGPVSEDVLLCWKLIRPHKMLWMCKSERNVQYLTPTRSIVELKVDSKLSTLVA